jgi:hypothetical protein
VERNYLDTLDQETALDIVFDNSEVQKVLSKDSFEVVSFTVEPAFKATITLRQKTSPNSSPKPDPPSSSNDVKISKTNL